jgi:HEPN domain-containing protein
MNETERVAEVRRWLRYAEEDLLAAEAALEAKGMAPRHACWLAQQSAEKAIKAVLIFLQIDFPRRHDLDALRNLVPAGWQVRESNPDLTGLTEWAVEARYPGEWPEAVKIDASAAAQQARAVWASVCADLAAHGLDIASLEAQDQLPDDR